jgi:hypothetical protein
VSGPPEPEPEGGDPACWAHEFEELLFGEAADGAAPDAEAGDRPTR